MLEQQANIKRASCAGQHCEMTGQLSHWADAILEFPELKYNVEPQEKERPWVVWPLANSATPLTFFFF